jgi:hypothetical protein
MDRYLNHIAAARRLRLVNDLHPERDSTYRLGVGYRLRLYLADCWSGTVFRTRSMPLHTA